MNQFPAPLSPSLTNQINAALANLEQSGLASAFSGQDSSWWSAESSAKSRPSWSGLVDQMAVEADDIIAFAEEVRKAGFQNVVVLGMGGSSLAADLLSTDFADEAKPGYPEVWTLDSDDPAVVAIVRDNLELKNTLFVVASQSGTTIETISLYNFFWELVQKRKGDKTGENFIAITEPGTELAKNAVERKFRRVFEYPPDTGWHFSALSYFALVPAALMGLDIHKLLASAAAMKTSCDFAADLTQNPGVWLSAALAALAQAGRDKMTLIVTPGIYTFGDWVELIVAAGSGKQGKGIVPVVGESIGLPSVYGDDRFFVYVRLDGDEETEDIDVALADLADAGFPVITLQIADLYDLGGEFYRWEVAIAVAAKLLGVNPFDEPDVAASKQNTKRLLEQYGGRLPEQVPVADEDSIELYAAGLTPSDNSVAGYLDALLAQIQPGDYFALLAYLDPSEESEESLQDIRLQVRDEYKVATTLGFGPRSLHSVGQLHKGGPNSGVFLMITADEAADIKIPGKNFNFGTLIRAQALGDLQALRDKDRRVVWLHMTNAEEGLDQLNNIIDSVLGQA